MKISLVCPSRARPHRFLEMVASAQRLCKRPDLMTVYLGLDRDDPRFNEYCETMPHGVVLIVNEEPRSVPHLMDWLAKQTAGDLVMAASDDLIFRSPGWDEMIRAEFAAVPDGMIVAGTNDLDGHRRIQHFVVTRKFIEVAGMFMPHDLEHFGGDAFMERVAQLIGRARYMDHVHVEHMHKKHQGKDGKPKGENDETYKSKRMAAKDGSCMSTRDIARLEAMKPQIVAAAAKVQKYIQEFGK